MEPESSDFDDPEGRSRGTRDEQRPRTVDVLRLLLVPVLAASFFAWAIFAFGSFLKLLLVGGAVPAFLLARRRSLVSYEPLPPVKQWPGVLLSTNLGDYGRAQLRVAGTFLAGLLVAGSLGLLAFMVWAEGYQRDLQHEREANDAAERLRRTR